MLTGPNLNGMQMGIPMGKLVTPVLDNLYCLTDDELQFYLDEWRTTVAKVEENLSKCQANLTKITDEFNKRGKDIS